ncbi:hypothetical protein ASPBRDRAFT_675005 [Aspergillus brasiliensis CBS 101740]|uniref:Zn(2)-C6 fungal-type domain-containing protein n=1 Tax=Aspergillus brasiliensis (strain CBS 101740 / IMI 381727 / IBT 21946) TaxID=767769 RepID=A0A1L9UK85_ASPBC|nr:hypothetical protein ASPBRDRAFT_675005 [Aspergillus brasiliensis CBS 101740]
MICLRCVRCRRQKSKCPGTQPCFSCSSRNLPCVFDDMTQKVLVTRRHIADSKQKAAQVKESTSDDHTSSTLTSNFSTRPAPSEISPDNLPDNYYTPSERDKSDSELVNPLASGPPASMSPGNARTWTASSSSFVRRVLSVVHEHVHKVPLPSEALALERTAYDLGWDGSRTDPIPESPVIPSLDHAKYLINSVKFRCGQLYHLFDDSDFMKSLYNFYSEDKQTRTRGLWYIHFLLIIAFGKMFTQVKIHERRPPGIDYFVRALQNLPDHTLLYSSPMISTEILCCIALFYQSLDCRSASHSYVGQAMRMAMAHGMHTCMTVTELEQDSVERCRKIWWTVYILDRHMASIQGLPQSIDDRFIQTKLPSSVGSEDITALDMNIRLCRSIADFNATVYVNDGKFDGSFVLNINAAVSNLTELGCELDKSFPLHQEGADVGLSRVSAYLHLYYEQGIILATRPVLFYLLTFRIGSEEPCAQTFLTIQNAKYLVKMCLDSAHHSIRILHALASQGLLETFLTNDLESLFTSTVVLSIASAMSSQLVTHDSWWCGTARLIFQNMVDAGNQMAHLRRSELQQLGTLLSLLSCQDQDGPSTSDEVSQQLAARPQPPFSKTGDTARPVA